MNNKNIISAIQKHVKNFNGKQVKAFYETELGFSDIFTEEDNYMDYFKSEDYLEKHIDKQSDIKHKLEHCGIIISDDNSTDVIKNTLLSLSIETLPIENSFKDKVLKMREDAINMIETKAYLGIMVFVGSILEGILLGILQNNSDLRTNRLRQLFQNSTNAPNKKEYPKIVFNDLETFVNTDTKLKSQKVRNVIDEYLKAKNFKKDKETDFSKWELNDLLTVSKKEGLLEDKMGRLAEIIQGARNYIHPNEQVKVLDFSSSNALISVTCLEEIVNNLKRYFTTNPENHIG
ncbi:MAG: hypothetical protein J6T70_12855 [Bacteroidales bacterium]|nr:hypothetical protein [Bacteroidales bacterium]